MIYFDNSSTSFPKLERVYSAMDKFYRECGGNPGRSGHRLSLKATQIVEDARSILANFFGVPEAKNMVFAFNATDAINMAVTGVLRPGDEVITSSLEHNSLLRPLRHLSREGLIKLNIILPAGETVRLADIEKNMTDKTRLVALTHASNVTGWVQPIEQIGRFLKNETPAVYFLVDAAQSAGLLPIDVAEMGIDLLAFTGHKALYGPMGTGGLYISDKVEIKHFRTGGGGDSDSDYHPDELPDKLEAGTLNAAGIAGLAEGVKFLMETGIENIRRREAELKDILLEGLRSIKGISAFTTEGKGQGLGILSFSIDGLAPTETASIMDAEGFAVRPGLHCAPLIHKYLGTFPQGSVRVSFGYRNTADEVGRFLEVVRAIAANF